MIDFQYQGETFRVSENLSRAQKIDAVIQIRKAHAERQNRGNPHFDVERMPEDYRAPSDAPRKRGRPRKNPSVQILPAKTVDTPTVTDDSLYAQGFYRVACVVCNEGIPRTGKRGRAPIYHDSCRPSEG